MRVTVGNSSRIVPPLRAIWIRQMALDEVTTLEKARLAHSMCMPMLRHSSVRSARYWGCRRDRAK